MAKKINSEFKIYDDNLFSVTMGTSNKKNPEVIYSILSTYVTPLSNDISEDSINTIEKYIKKQLNSLMITNTLCYKDVIIVSDVASNRMICGKQTFLDIQIYFKPTINILCAENKNFKNIATKIYESYIKEVVKNIENLLQNDNFSLSTFKNKAVHKAIY